MSKKLMRFASAVLAGSVLLTGGMTAAAVDIEKPQPPVVLTLTSTLNVYVDGEASVDLSDEYKIGEQVTLNAPEIAGKTFAGWEVETPNGDRVLASTKNDFTLVLNSDIDAYAMYKNAGVTQKSVVSFTSAKQVIYSGHKVISLTATRSIADGDKVSAAGFVYTNDKLLSAESMDNLAEDELVSLLTDEETDGKPVKVHEVEVTDNADGDWTLNLIPSADDTHYCMISYIIVNGEKIYSDPISLTYDSMKDATSDMMNAATDRNYKNS